jgi:D-alanyl-D-alanine carboxypeptidase
LNSRHLEEELNVSIRKAIHPVTILALLLIPAALPGCASTSVTEQVAEVRFVELQQRLEGFRAEFDIPGASMGFVLSDGSEGAVVAGMADREASIPMAMNNKLLAGSIGKTYVAAVALQLVGEGELELDAPISRWLGRERWFPRLPNGKWITVRMLMNHTSGIPEHIYRPEFGDALAESPYRIWKPEELVAFILGAEPLFAPGKDMSYADTNYIVLGIILEKITGRPYYESLKRRILDPLALSNTVPSDRPEIPGLIPGYAERPSPLRNKGRTMRDGRLVLNPQGEWTGGGLASTPLDLARWAHRVYRGEAFAEELLDQALDGVPAFDREGEKYGLGVQTWQGRHGPCWGHGGWFPGYLSLMAYFPETGLALAVQINTDGTPDAGVKMRELLDDFAELITGPRKP